MNGNEREVRLGVRVARGAADGFCLSRASPSRRPPGGQTRPPPGTRAASWSPPLPPPSLPSHPKESTRGSAPSNPAANATASRQGSVGRGDEGAGEGGTAPVRLPAPAPVLLPAPAPLPARSRRAASAGVGQGRGAVGAAASPPPPAAISARRRDVASSSSHGSGARAWVEGDNRPRPAIPPRPARRRARVAEESMREEKRRVRAFVSSSSPVSDSHFSFPATPACGGSHHLPRTPGPSHTHAQAPNAGPVSRSTAPRAEGVSPRSTQRCPRRRRCSALASSRPARTRARASPFSLS